VPVPGPVEPKLEVTWPSNFGRGKISSRTVAMPAGFACDEYIGLVGGASDRDMKSFKRVI